MSQFPKEMKVIPWAAWVIAVGNLGFGALLQMVLIPRDPKLAAWPEPVAMCFSIAMAMFLFIYTLLIGYVNGDSRRRGMRYVLWTLLAIFIPNGIGIILYFILRDPLPQVCPKCGVTVRSKGAFCPACGAALRNTCSACHGALEPGWSHCTSCGAEVPRA